jgi:hypothetical protein
LLKKDYVSIVFVLNGKEARRAEIPAGGTVRRTPHGIQRTNKNFPGWPLLRNTTFCGSPLSMESRMHPAFQKRSGLVWEIKNDGFSR